MNKNLKNTIINNYPIISIIILGLIYLYLELPNNILKQTGGGEKTWTYPPNTPSLYKYRFAFVTLPILLIILIIYYAYYTYAIVPTVSVWDLGLEFFANFQKQFKIAVENPAIGKSSINYKFEITDKMKKSEPELAKFFNMIQLTNNPLSTLYVKAQYFCNTTRPCSCCLDDNYTTYFFGCKNASQCNTDSYNRICKPSNSSSSNKPSNSSSSNKPSNSPSSNKPSNSPSSN
jgi:hypothetical protein